MGAFSKLFSFEDQLGFYGAYHANPINVGIHMVFVPTIFWTALVWAANTPAAFEYAYSQYLPANLSLFATVGYASYFIALEPLAGTLYAPILLGMCRAANVFLQTNPKANSIAALLHVASWVAQFAGHFLAEGRAPALFDNLLQSLVLAVFFVWVELLFMLGYRPDLRKRLEAKIKKDIEAYKKAKQAKADGKSN
ncbi:hypothetical protein SmJEL517_g02608 [Synchytrium microbalum]|uniref:DUF962-domain-containing protein n=1 Tax=Synchytrium microbalum TaxID=1806994 RepID=A0A507C5X5_9FUNG|nr:uncharacterized protein SmJEL517_g02608 [Synchytrium microbalum]TPX34911.1 hypothetical protein SmJEL517_g02608 [Synchytrium microbalum]